MNPFAAIANVYSGLKRLAADRDPTSNFWYGDIGAPVKSHVTVTDSTALTYSAVWAATRLLSATTGLIPLDLYRRIPGGGREVVLDDPRETLVHDRPNGEMGAMMFRAQASQQQINAGNCFSEIERDRAGRPVALWPIHYTRVTIKRTESKQLVYEVKNDRAEPTLIPPADILHVSSMMSDDGIVGKGVIKNARESIGFGIATEQYGASWFGNGGMPKVIVSSPLQMKPDARDNFRKEWRETYGGPDGSKVGLLTAGMTASTLNISAEDQQFLETRQHNVEEIARWYGVPPHMIQHLLRATFNNIEHMGIEFVTYSLLPWLKLWEQELWAKLLTPDEQQSLYFEFNVNALLRGDSKSRGELYQMGINSGWMRPNEAREMENLNPYEGGDEFYMQGAMMPVEMLGKQAQAAIDQANQPDPPPKSAAQQDDRRAVVVAAAGSMLKLAAERMIRREARDARYAAKSPDSFIKWLDSFYTEAWTMKFAEAIHAPCVALDALGFAADAQTIASMQAAKSHGELLELSGNCTATELSQQVDGLMTEWERHRPAQMAEAVISRTEQT